MIAFVGGRLITPSEIIKEGVILVEHDRIRAVGPRDGIVVPAGAQRFEVNGRLVTPGFIDLHVHGGGGAQAIDGSQADVLRMVKFHAQHGTTGLLVTVAGSEAHLRAGIQAALNAQAIEAEGRGATVLGIHLEGPYINPKMKGAFREESLQQPNLAGLTSYLESAQGQIRLITLAPELPGALSLIAAARERGVVVAVGHSAATWDQMLEAIEAGLTHAAHTFNAMSRLHHREPSVVGAVLTQDCLTAEVIADGLHVHPAVIALLVRAKGSDRVVLITDAIKAAGLSEGEYELEEQGVVVAQGAARLADGTLAGSLLTMERGVANLVAQVGLSLPEAVGMATLNPARVLGLAGCKGSLSPGKDADLVIMTEDYQVVMTVVKGRIVYMAE